MCLRLRWNLEIGQPMRLSICRCVATRCNPKADFTHTNQKVWRAIKWNKRSNTIGENKPEALFERPTADFLVVWKLFRCFRHVGICQGILVAVSKVIFLAALRRAKLCGPHRSILRLLLWQWQVSGAAGMLHAVRPQFLQRSSCEMF